jgi:hypothetical protein
MISSVQKLVFSVATYYLSHISNKIHTYLFFCQTNRCGGRSLYHSYSQGGMGMGLRGIRMGGGG